MKSLDNANSLGLIFNNVDVYIEENNENKCLIFASTDKNKKVLENYTELWDQIEAISDVKPIKYKKSLMKSKFESNDDLLFGNTLSIPVCIVTVEFEYEDDSYSIA